MPFTISHAAAVLPLHRSGKSRLPLAALMVGSMSPDFAYFLPTSLDRPSSHDLEGILFFCLPVGMAVWFLFVSLLERPTIDLLPSAWRERVPRSERVTPRVLLFASLAVVLGALSHVAWDAFTHASTPITDAFPVFNTDVFSFRGRTVRVYLLLQYLSSVIGLMTLAWWGWNLRHTPLPRDAGTEPRSSLSDRARIIALLAIITASGVNGLLGYVQNLRGPFEARVYNLLIGGMSGWALAWLAVALCIRRLSLRRP